MGCCEGKNALVTGASRGIGRAIAKRLAAEGANVVLCASRLGRHGNLEGTLDESAEEIRRDGGNAATAVADLLDGDARSGLVAQAEVAFGPLDILVNNAGLSAGTVIWELEPDVFNRVIAVHLQGSFNCTRHAVTHMKEKGWGRIINLVSRSGLIGVAGNAAYGAGKGGIFGFTNVISRDLAPYGVTVNGVNPSSTDTRMVSEAIHAGLKQGGARAKMAENLKSVLQTPHDVAVLIAALCSNQAADITGQFFFVRRTEVGLFQPLTLTQTMSREEAWTADALADALTKFDPFPLNSPY